MNNNKPDNGKQTKTENVPFFQTLQPPDESQLKGSYTMIRMKRTEFLNHIQALMSDRDFEVAGETWRYDPAKDEWIQQEPFMRRCPYCGRDAMVNVRDSTACVDGILIADPENHSLCVDYSTAKTELYNPGYYCSACGRQLDLQSTDDFAEEYRLRIDEAAQ